MRNRGLIRPHHSVLVLVQRGADAGLIALVHVALTVAYSPSEWTDHDTVATGAAATLFLFAAEAAGLYHGWRGVPLRMELFRVFAAWAVVAAVVGFRAVAL